MGDRPPPHGRTPTAPWAIAHRPVGAGFLRQKNKIISRGVLLLYFQHFVHLHIVGVCGDFLDNLEGESYA